MLPTSFTALAGRGVAAVLLLVGLAVPVSAQPSAGATTDGTHRTDLSTVIAQSIRLLMIEHGTRIAFQPKTRHELDGPFFHDFRRSIRWPRQWEDADPWEVNYVGHPIHGAATALIWLDYGAERRVPLGGAKAYWASRGRAAAYAAIYSLQFEIGPLSEASIGNVGMRPETTGWVDHVLTPGGAFALIVAEDALDRWFVQWVERRVGNRVARASLRLVFNPSRTLANVAEMRAPWERRDRLISR